MDGQSWKVSEIFEPGKLNINQWAEEDRPREKLQKLGAEALSTAELLAILIGSGNTEENAVELMKKILHNCGNKLKTLGRMSISELTTYNGIGEAKAITILAACELGKRRQAEGAVERPDLSTAQLIYEYMHPKMMDLDHEESWVLLMNHNFRLIKDVRLSKGGLTETAVDVRTIIKEAVLANATIIALVHNHPSNNPEASRDDDRITNNVKEACRVMRLYFADHIIVTDGDYYSYQENGKV